MMCQITCLSLLALAFPAAPAEPVIVGDKFITSIIEEETFAIVRLNVARLDADGLLKVLGETLPDSRTELANTAAKVKEFYSAFTKAGGSETAIVFSTPELPQPSLIFIRLKNGADEPKLTQLLQSVLYKSLRVERKENALVAGDPAALKRFASAKPGQRSELPLALAAVGDAGVQVLFLPSNDQRRVIDEVTPLLPQWGGFTGKTLTQGVRWAALGLDVSPTPSLKLALQSADKGAAAKMAALIHDGFRLLGKQAVFGEDKPFEIVYPNEYKSITDLEPKLTDDRLTAELANPQALKTIATLVALLDGTLPGTSQSVNQLRQINLALHNYASVNSNSLPPTTIRSKENKPLLSWRVAILPFLGENALYREFKLDEPWDSEHNKKLIEKMPKVYRSLRIKDKRPGLTTYLAPVGTRLVFTGGGKGIRIGEITDGTSNTIMVVDVADELGVIWTKPDDLPIDLNNPKKGLLGHYKGFFLVGMADGSVHLVSKSVSVETLRAAFTRDGEEAVGADW